MSQLVPVDLFESQVQEPESFLFGALLLGPSLQKFVGSIIDQPTVCVGCVDLMVGQRQDIDPKGQKIRVVGDVL